MSKTRRIAKARAREKKARLHAERNSTYQPTCHRCGERGRHFVPPSFGDTGFFICDPNDGPRPSREHYDDDWSGARDIGF